MRVKRGLARQCSRPGRTDWIKQRYDLHRCTQAILSVNTCIGSYRYVCIQIISVLFAML